MATSTITNTLTDGSGTAIAGTTVIATLMPAPGFRVSDSSEIASRVTTTTNGSGVWSLALERNANITPAGTWWGIEEQIPTANGGPQVWAISVGASNSTLQAARITPTTDTSLASYITQAAGDARYALIGTATHLSIFNVADYGADITGATSSQGAVTQAIAAAQALTDGGLVYFPAGTYLVTGITITDGPPVHLIGAGGKSPNRSSAPQNVAASRLISTTNAPILTFTAANKASTLPNISSSISDLAVMGLTTAGSSQHGIVVDQRGIDAYNVTAAGCGGRGWLLSDSVSGTYVNCTAHQNALDGWRLDPTTGTGVNSAVTDNTFISLIASQNTSHGVTIQGAAWGNVFIGGDLESNGGYGLIFDVVGGGAPRFCRGLGLWAENNTSGPVRINNTSVQDIEFDFSRIDDVVSYATGSYRTNELTASNISLTGRAQRRLHQLGSIQSNGGATSSDIDIVAVRNHADSDDGDVRMRRLYLTGAAGQAAAADTPTTTPFFTSRAGSPESAIAAPPGSICVDTTGGEVYVKNSGTSNTGWKIITHA